VLSGRNHYAPYTTQPLRSAITDSCPHNHVYYIMPRQLNLRKVGVRRTHGYKWNPRKILSVLLRHCTFVSFIRLAVQDNFTAMYPFELQNVTCSPLAFSSHWLIFNIFHQLKCSPVSIIVFACSATWGHLSLSQAKW
jgi:hypothetical protein